MTNMKKFSYIFIGLLALLFATACEEPQDVNPVLQTPTKFVLNNPVMSTQYIQLTPTSTVNLSCSQPDYGYAAAATTFDKQLAIMVEKMKDRDILMITADHGNDPCFKGSDHTREMVPLVMYNNKLKKGIELNEKMTYACIGATIIENFGVLKKDHQIGESLLKEIEKIFAV